MIFTPSNGGIALRLQPRRLVAAAAEPLDRRTRMVPISPMQNDDERFLALVSRIASTLIRDIRPTDVFVTRIDHWFDHK